MTKVYKSHSWLVVPYWYHNKTIILYLIFLIKYNLFYIMFYEHKKNFLLGIVLFGTFIWKKKKENGNSFVQN